MKGQGLVYFIRSDRVGPVAALDSQPSKRLENGSNMCLAIPALVTKAEGGTGLVEIGGIERSVSFALTPEAKVGDYVLLHTGFAISVLDPEEAQETLQLFAELAQYYPVDDEARRNRGPLPQGYGPEEALRGGTATDSPTGGQTA